MKKKTIENHRSRKSFVSVHSLAANKPVHFAAKRCAEQGDALPKLRIGCSISNLKIQASNDSKSEENASSTTSTLMLFSNCKRIHTKKKRGRGGCMVKSHEPHLSCQRFREPKLKGRMTKNIKL